MGHAVIRVCVEADAVVSQPECHVVPARTWRERLLCAAIGPGRRGLAVVCAVGAVVLAGCGSGHTAAIRPGTRSGSSRAYSAAAVATLRTTDGAVVRVPSARPSVLLFITVGCEG